LPARDVFWEGSSGLNGEPASTGWKMHAPATGRPPATAELKIRSIRGLGADEKRPTYNSGTQTRTITITGTRRVIAQVKIVSARQSAGMDCQALAELMRTRLQRDSIQDVLQTYGVAIADIRESASADFVSDDGRQMSACVSELLIWLGENDVDDAAGSADWIEHARTVNEVGSPVVLDTGFVPLP